MMLSNGTPCSTGFSVFGIGVAKLEIRRHVPRTRRRLERERGRIIHTHIILATQPHSLGRLITK